MTGRQHVINMRKFYINHVCLEFEFGHVLHSFISIVEKKIKEVHRRAIAFNHISASNTASCCYAQGMGIIPQGMLRGKQHYRTKV
jgi:hypothetical protein